LRFAGLRLREAAGLQLGDVDFMRRTLIVERQIEGQINSRTAETSPKYESAASSTSRTMSSRCCPGTSEHVAPHGEDGYLFSLRGYVYNRNSAGNQWRRGFAGRSASTSSPCSTCGTSTPRD